MNIALVYDRVNKFGGAERVLLALSEIWPDAPLYTAIYDAKATPWAKRFLIRSSFLQYLPFLNRHHEMLPLLAPLTFESFSFDEFDVVLTITSGEAKAILTKPKTCHICYCLTPTRYLWSGFEDYLEEPGVGICNPIVAMFLRLLIPYLRRSDYLFAKRPDRFLAISTHVQKRIRTYYKEDSSVLYPGADAQIFTLAKTKRQRFFLIVSRLVPYKKIDYVIMACNRFGWNLKIIGSGIDEKRLRNIAGETVEFIGGDLTDKKLCWYYQRCQALIFPGDEDFGLTAVEAQLCGSPVLAYAKSGVAETIIPGTTGEVYSEKTANALHDAVAVFRTHTYQANACRENAMRFSKHNFQKHMKETIETYWDKWSKRP